MTALKKRRLASKMKLREIAAKTGVTPQMVWQQERDGIKTMRIAKRYATVFGCSPLDLIED